MKKYLSTLHTRPDRHKKRFALLVSGGTTLMIFTLWCLVTFGTGEVLAKNPSTSSGQAVNSLEVGPVDSLRNGMASSIEGLSQVLGTMKAGFTSVVGGKVEYQAEQGTLNTYGPVRSDR